MTAFRLRKRSFLLLALFSFFEQIPNRERGFFIYSVVGRPFGVADQAHSLFAIERIGLPLNARFIFQVVLAFNERFRLGLRIPNFITTLPFLEQAGIFLDVRMLVTALQSASSCSVTHLWFLIVSPVTVSI